MPRVPALTLLALAAACRPDASPQARVDVVPGSTANTLTLRVTAPPVSAFRVAGSRLEGRRYAGSIGPTYWFLAPAGGAASATLPTELHYGQAPPDFTGTTPVMLAPGAYEVEVTTEGRHSLSYFRVANDGTVR